MMKVTLISCTPNPELVVASAARLCYSKSNPTDVIEDMTPQACAELITKVQSMGHLSTFEHANFTFGIQGVSRVLSHQLVRHRIASYSQRSQRYVDEGECNVVIPPSIVTNPEAFSLYEEFMYCVNKIYDALKDAGIPNEDARYCLTNATETNIIVTMNARTLLNFFQERCCNRAQWEIRQMAKLMLTEVRKTAPNLFKIAGPTCLTQGICHQGTMSCGRIKDCAWDKN